MNKLPEWYKLIYEHNFDMIFITESWLYDGFPSSLLDPYNRFYVIRCDRQFSRGGGVSCLVSKH